MPKVVTKPKGPFENGLKVDGAARARAVRVARDLLSGAVMEGRLPVSDVIVATDHIGQTAVSLRLGAAVGRTRL